jgi:sec-independent protein translocase protein TatB
MFDIDGGKLLIIGIVALVVIGPKELPGVMRQVGQAIARLRRMAAEFQGQFMDAMRESELEELRKDVSKMAKGDLGGLDAFDHVRDQMSTMKADIETALEFKPSDPNAPSPGSVDFPKLPDVPGDGEASLGASGIAPTADSAEVAATPDTGDLPADRSPATQTVASGGHP